jgi:hypothetical protein
MNINGSFKSCHFPFAFSPSSIVSDRVALARASLASLDNAITVGSNGNDRPDDGRKMALIKEGEFESPEMIAVIERNREDRERTVVIDR